MYKEYGFNLFLETSAKTGYNARNVLIEAAKLLYSDYLKNEEANPKGDNKPGQKKGEELKDNFRFEFFLETSAKDGNNIEKLFVEIGKILYRDSKEKNKVNKVRNI